METPEYFVGIRQTANPHVPPCILNPTSQSNKDIHDDQDWEWRVSRYDCKGQNMTCWSDKCHPSTAETLVNQVTQDGRHSVAQEWRQKHQRDNRIVLLVGKLELDDIWKSRLVMFIFPFKIDHEGSTNVRNDRSICSVIGAHHKCAPECRENPPYHNL